MLLSERFIKWGERKGQMRRGRNEKKKQRERKGRRERGRERKERRRVEWGERD